MKKKNRFTRGIWILEKKKGCWVRSYCANSALDQKKKRLKGSLATTIQKKKRPVNLTRRSLRRRAYPKQRFLPGIREEINLMNNYSANSALEFYNENNPGDEFELVEVVSYNCFAKLWRRWHHLNFTAKPKNASSDSSPKLFFAELCDGFASGPYRRCSIVDPSDFSETNPGCGFCDPEWKDRVRVYHPVGFLRGRNSRYRPRRFVLPRDYI